MNRSSNHFPSKATVLGLVAAGGVTTACGLVILTGWIVGGWPVHANFWPVMVLICALLFGAAASVGLLWRQRLFKAQATAAEAELQMEKLNLDAIFESSPVAMLILDEATNIVRYNTAALVLAGGSASDVLQQRPGNALRCVHCAMDPRGCGYSAKCPLCPLRNGVEALLANGGSIHGTELTIQLIRDGVPQKVWLRIGAETILIHGHRHVCISMEDITERTLTMEALVEAKALLQAALDCSTAGIAIADAPSGQLRYVNQAGLLIRGSSEAEVVTGVDVNQYVASWKLLDLDGKPLAVEEVPLARAVLFGERCTREFIIHRSASEDRVVLANAAPILNPEGQVIAGIVVFLDITERRQADGLVKASLLEKESLLKEIHHRVKNNLQIISSLLRLQSDKIDNPVAKAALQDMQNRVRSMALVHESLYGSEIFASVDFAAYLKQLCHQLSRALVATPGRIQLHVDLAPVRLNIDQAIPCGLLVNELVSNAFKHAFPDDRRGELRVELQAPANGRGCRLRVSDDGVGLPTDLDLQHLTSLGLKLVVDLVRQIGGRLEIGPAPGAVFEIEFVVG